MVSIDSVTGSFKGLVKNTDFFFSSCARLITGKRIECSITPIITRLFHGSRKCSNDKYNNKECVLIEEFGSGEKVYLDIQDNYFLSVELDFCFHCHRTTIWSRNAQIQLQISKSNGEKITIMKNINLNSIPTIFKLDKIAKLKDVLGPGRKYKLPNGNIELAHQFEIKAHVKIESVLGFQPPENVDFSIARNIDSEIMLQVGNEQLYIDKYVLMAHSPVFRAMLTSNFSESNEKKIEIKDVESSILIRFLRILSHEQQEITKENVEDLLTLADRYNVQFLILNCEKFLISTEKVSKIGKLLLAEQYKFKRLQDKVLENITKTEIDEIQKYEIQAETKDALFNKLLRM